MSNQDIREWARANGRTIGDRGRIPDDIRADYYAENGDGEEADYGQPVTVEVGVPEKPSAPAVPPPPPENKPVPERKPQAPPRKRKGLFGRKDKRVHKRVSIENIVSSGWALGAMALMRSPNAAPVGRVMQIQAPVAGAVLEDVARGTLVDKILQPLARGGEKGEAVLALAGPPLLVGAICARPELYNPLRPMLKMAMMSWLRISGPAIKKAQADAAKFEEEFGDIDLDATIAGLFADLPSGPVSEQEEEHIRRARGE